MKWKTEKYLVKKQINSGWYFKSAITAMQRALHKDEFIMWKCLENIDPVIPENIVSSNSSQWKYILSIIIIIMSVCACRAVSVATSSVSSTKQWRWWSRWRRRTRLWCWLSQGGYTRYKFSSNIFLLILIEAMINVSFMILKHFSSLILLCFDHCNK